MDVRHRAERMSEVDQAWQAASLEKDRVIREGTPPDEQETSRRGEEVRPHQLTSTIQSI